LRFGLPGDEAAWRRLELALTALPVNATQKKVAKC
jgi:hypothetical protein